MIKTHKGTRMKNKLFIFSALLLNTLAHSFSQPESFPYLKEMGEDDPVYCECKNQEGLIWLFDGPLMKYCQTLEKNLEHAAKTGEIRGFERKPATMIKQPLGNGIVAYAPSENDRAISILASSFLERKYPDLDDNTIAHIDITTIQSDKFKMAIKALAQQCHEKQNTQQELDACDKELRLRIKKNNAAQDN